ncbi:NAD(P)-dependent dehydrogenase (short-subunit alcohol dehydrogenase family) [Bradyrhizobium sp. USDA 4524]|nr:NAD(P)-dependent dehydrogenase (short-subunit alcohol dehydrogenase family) [Bradyrhizobium sp. USDA 4538]MCP1906991.1 NAD(P)-dependent dehydrogenase (short-subunit alcohol dehydrogenase family) [Bradyrhizobium sp. USDA 4537]MCP1985467.1 NAD(P)-dependent dehydrogenase (short-subunit alcohol dehydrogenase family) [Bradyrhizobium sp. USDA 4539]
MAEVAKRHGRLDVMVSNAGISINAPSIVEMSPADWRRQTAINLDGVFLSVKYSLPLMRKHGGGSIIMMSSLAGLGVNSVHPGIIDTPMWGKIPTGTAGARQNAPIDPDEGARFATPLGRAGQAIQIAQGALYLASDASRYVTGTEIVIDGSMNAGGVVRQA